MQTKPETTRHGKSIPLADATRNRVFALLDEATRTLQGDGIHACETGLLMVAYGALTAERNIGAGPTTAAITSLIDALRSNAMSVECGRPN